MASGIQLLFNIQACLKKDHNSDTQEILLDNFDFSFIDELFECVIINRKTFNKMETFSIFYVWKWLEMIGL